MLIQILFVWIVAIPAAALTLASVGARLRERSAVVNPVGRAPQTPVSPPTPASDGLDLCVSRRRAVKRQRARCAIVTSIDKTSI